LSLWDKTDQDCVEIIKNYFANMEKHFGQKPTNEGLSSIVAGMLDQKVIKFTEDTFQDLTPQTLIKIGKMLLEPKRVEVVHSFDNQKLASQVNKKQKQKL
jgi:hypothetical protein